MYVVRLFFSFSLCAADFACLYEGGTRSAACCCLSPVATSYCEAPLFGRLLLGKKKQPKPIFAMTLCIK